MVAEPRVELHEEPPLYDPYVDAAETGETETSQSPGGRVSASEPAGPRFAEPKPPEPKPPELKPPELKAPGPKPTAPRPANTVDLGLLEELTTGLGEVQAALDKLDKGTYGLCEHCGGQIDDAILESSPTAQLCAAHLPFGSRSDPGDMVHDSAPDHADAEDRTGGQIHVDYRSPQQTRGV